MPDLVSGRGASRFVVTTPSRRVIESEVVGGARQNLLQQAASLLPDHQALTDTLLEYDLPMADRQAAQGRLDQMTQSYLQNYGADPFYAFTQEGRRTARRMQQVVHDPNLKFAQDLKKQNDKELDKAQQEGVLDKILVSSNGIGVIRDGKKMFVQTPQEGDSVLTVNDEYRHLNEVLGYKGGKYVVPLRSFDKAMQSVRTAFSSIGSNEWKKENIDPDSLLSSMTSGKSNQRQVDQAADLLINKGGLSNEDWNTLKSEYLSSVGSGQVSGEFSDKAAKKAVVEMVLTQARAQTATSSGVTYDENPFLKAKQKGLDKAPTISGLERGFYGLNGVRPRLEVTPNGTIAMTNTARKVGAELFQTSTNEVYREDLGQKVASHRLKDLPLLADSQEVIYANAIKDGKKAKNGEFLRLPADAYREAIIADGSTGEEDTPAFVTMPVGPDGNPLPYDVASRLVSAVAAGAKIPQEYRKYVSYDEQGQPSIAQGQFVDAVAYIPKQRSIWGSEINANASSEMLEDHGYQMGYQKPDQDYINTHSGRNTDIIRNTSDFGFNLEDGYYKVRIKTPVPSYFKIRGAGGEKVHTQLEDTHIDTGDFNKQSVPINPSLLDDNAFLPNLKTQGTKKFSQLK